MKDLENMNYLSRIRHSDGNLAMIIIRPATEVTKSESKKVRIYRKKAVQKKEIDWEKIKKYAR